MNILMIMNEVIGYVEDHLESEIDYGEIIEMAIHGYYLYCLTARWRLG